MKNLTDAGRIARLISTQRNLEITVYERWKLIHFDFKEPYTGEAISMGFNVVEFDRSDDDIIFNIGFRLGEWFGNGKLFERMGDKLIAGDPLPEPKDREQRVIERMAAAPAAEGS